jgi:hypothetical protein
LLLPEQKYFRSQIKIRVREILMYPVAFKKKKQDKENNSDVYRESPKRTFNRK